MDISSATPGAIVYVVAAGGNSQGYAPSSATTNDAIKLATVAGAYCVSGTGGCTFPDTVQMNELTTVATAYAMAGFTHFDSYVDIYASTTNATGLHNAATTFANLVDAASGQAVVPNASGCTDPSTEPVNCEALRALDTLANIAAACVNDESSAGSACTGSGTGLLTEATPSGGTEPGDTLAALYNIVTAGSVRNDASGIYGLSPTTPIFAPTLTAAPDAWTLSLNYTGNGLSNPDGIAVDASGNVWVSNLFGSSPNPVSISAFYNDGSAKGNYSGNGLSAPFGIAVDSGGNVWVANSGNGSISAFHNDGSAKGNYPNSNLNTSHDIAIDSSDNVWVANETTNNNNQLNEFNNSGSHIGGPFQGQTNAYGDAIDSNDNVWVTSDGAQKLLVYDSSKAYASANVNTAGLNPHGIAIDSNNNAWVADNSNSSISEFSYNGNNVILGGTHTGNGLSGPEAIAVDASGNVWAANYSNPSISAFQNDGSAIGNYSGNGLSGAFDIAVDASGNVWVANSSGGSGSITEFIGIAAPTRTPIVSAITNGFTP